MSKEFKDLIEPQKKSRFWTGSFRKKVRKAFGKKR